MLNVPINQTETEAKAIPVMVILKVVKKHVDMYHFGKQQALKVLTPKRESRI